jgi:cobalamin-dependent methionine synthase I
MHDLFEKRKPSPPSIKKSLSLKIDMKIERPMVQISDRNIRQPQPIQNMKNKLWIPIIALPLIIGSCEKKAETSADKLKDSVEKMATGAKDAIDSAKASTDAAVEKAKAATDAAVEKAKEATDAAAKMAEEKKKEIDDAVKKAADAIPTPDPAPAPEPTPAPPPMAPE